MLSSYGIIMTPPILLIYVLSFITWTSTIEVTEKVVEDSLGNDITSPATININKTASSPLDTMQRITIPIMSMLNKKNFTPSPQLPNIFNSEDFLNSNPRINMHSLRSTPQKPHGLPQEFKSAGDYDYSNIQKFIKNMQKGGDKPSMELNTSMKMQSDSDDKHMKSLSDYDQDIVHLYLKHMKNSQTSGVKNTPTTNGNLGSTYHGYKPVKFDTDFTGNRDIPGFGSVEKVPLTYNPQGFGGHPYPYHYYGDPVPSRIPGPVYSDGEVSVSSYISKESHAAAGGPKEHGGSKSGSGGGLLKKVMNMLAAFIPLGLFLAAIPPNMLNINSSSTSSRQRSVDAADIGDSSNPLLTKLDNYGLESLNDPECESYIFCKMSRMGSTQEGNVVQRAFWNLAHHTPDKVAAALGFKEVFKAVRTDSCAIYRCKQGPATTPLPAVIPES